MPRLILISGVIVAYIGLWIKSDAIGLLFLEKETPHLLRILNQGEVTTFTRRRITKGLIILGIGIVAFSVNQPTLIWVGLCLLAVVIVKWPEIRLKTMYRTRCNQLKVEFPIWLRQLQILLQHNTVVQSLKLSHSHAPQLFKIALSDLVAELEKTPQELALYTTFLDEYQSIEVQRAMKLLYRYNAIGSEDATRQLSRLIQATTKWLRDQRASTQSTTLAIVGWWGMLPLVGVSGLFMIMMVQTVMTILERR